MILGLDFAWPPRRSALPLGYIWCARRACVSISRSTSAPNFPDRPVPDPHQTISEADLRRANETSVQRRGSGAVGTLVRLSVIWPAFHMLSDLMRGREVSPGA